VVQVTQQSEAIAPGGQPRSRFRSFGWGLALVALVAWTIRVVDSLRYDPPTWFTDATFYHEQANFIANGYGFARPLTEPPAATALHPPLYPLLLSISSVFGAESFLSHQMVSVLIGTAGVVVIGLLGREIGGKAVGLVAAALAAVYPNLWVLDDRLWSEGLAATLTATVLLFAYRFRRRRTMIDALVLGALLGLAGLARSETLLLLVLVAVPIALLGKGESWLRRLTYVGVIGVAAVAVLSPWIVRNLMTFDRPVPFSTNGNLIFAVTNCDRTYRGAELGSWEYHCSRYHGPGDESEIAFRAQEKGLDYLMAHRERFVTAVVWARIGRMWDVYRPIANARGGRREGRSVSLSYLGLAAYWAILPFAAVGVWCVHRLGRVPVWPLLMVLVATTIVAAVSYGASRFRAPAETALIVLAAVGLCAGWQWLRRTPRLTTGSVAGTGREG
jgi:Dolichyl-phosphate-mannose-protein mannosyltransferase